MRVPGSMIICKEGACCKEMKANTLENIKVTRGKATVHSNIQMDANTLEAGKVARGKAKVQWKNQMDANTLEAGKVARRKAWEH